MHEKRSEKIEQRAVKREHRALGRMYRAWIHCCRVRLIWYQILDDAHIIVDRTKCMK